MHADGVKAAVGEHRAEMALHAIGSRADEQSQTSHGGGVDGGVIASHVAVKRRISADALSQVGLHSLSKVCEDVVHNFFVPLGHCLPLLVAWLSGCGKFCRVRVAWVKPRIQRVQMIGSMTTTSVIAMTMEDGVVLRPILIPNHVSHLEAAAVLGMWVLGIGQGICPRRIRDSIVLPPHVVISGVDNAGNIAKHPSRSESGGMWIFLHASVGTDIEHPLGIGLMAAGA